MTTSNEFECPNCGALLGPLDEDIDAPGTFVCEKCLWVGREPMNANREIGFGIAVEILARITQLANEVSPLDSPIVMTAYQDIVRLVTKGE